MSTVIQHPVNPLSSNINPSHSPVGNNPIDKLVASLNNEFENKGDGPTVQRLLEDYIRNNKDWKDYAHFCPHKYSRNLVARTNMYELMVICWGEGQKSPIHNHEGQRCWMGMLDGELEETYFQFVSTKSTRGTGPLEQTECRPLEKGSVGYITDDIALHVIRPVTKTAVSLHLYSLPIPECSLYCPATGTVTRRRLGFYTEYKKMMPQQDSVSCSPSQATPVSL